jgi:hypothetical protein
MEKFGHSFDKPSSIGDSAKTIMNTPEIYGNMITNSISSMQEHFEREYLHFPGYKYGLDSHSAVYRPLIPVPFPNSNDEEDCKASSKKE